MSDQKPHLHVEFFTEPVENKRESINAGRPIFEDRDFVRVKIAGDPKNTLVAPADAECARDRSTNEPITYRDRFPEHYRYFSDHKSNPILGTPLGEVSWLPASKVAELKALNIMTVEALAGLDGTALQRLGMGGRELKNQAEAWLDRAAGSVDAGKFAAELSVRDAEIEQLKRDIAELRAGRQTSATEPEPPTPASSGDDDGLGENSPFWAWDDDDIKNWIKDNAGAKPSGTPSHKTLVAKADALNADLAAKQNAKAA